METPFSPPAVPAAVIAGRRRREARAAREMRSEAGPRPLAWSGSRAAEVAKAPDPRAWQRRPRELVEEAEGGVLVVRVE